MQIAAGSEVLISVETRDAKQATLPLGNPNLGVVLTLYNPAGTAILTAQSLTNISTGTWRYAYQTTGASPLGTWTAIFTATDGATIVTTPKVQVFELI